MKIGIWRVAAIGALLGAGRVLGQATTQPMDDAEHVHQLVVNLGSTNETDRVAAERAIEDLPFKDLPALTAAEGDSNLSAESRTAIHHIMESLRPELESRARKSAQREAAQKHGGEEILQMYAGSHVDEKWDDLARTALTDFLKWLDSGSGTTDLRTQLAKEFDAAANAGCDNAEFLYSRARFMLIYSKNRKANIALMKAAVAAMEASPGVDEVHKGVPHIRLVAAMRGISDPDIDKEKELSTGIHEFVEGLGKSTMLPDEATRNAMDVIAMCKTAGQDENKLFDEIEPALEKAFPNAPEPLVMKGRHYINWAWEARGSGWGNTVTPDGWKLMADRLEVANQSLSRAYELDPNDPDAATAMLTVELGQGRGRDVMEQWFARAMKADPDDYEACNAKLYYLEPKWYGNEKAMLDFAHECVEGGNWVGNIPYIVITARQNLLAYQADPAGYYRSPEVWTDIQSFFEEYLARYPNSTWAETEYVQWACNCEKWKKAVELFDLIGDKPDARRIRGSVSYDALRAKALEKAKEEMDDNSKQGL